jgi:hypothetical protein
MDTSLSNIEENKWQIFNQNRALCSLECTFYAICPMTVYSPHPTCMDLSINEKKRFFHLFLYGSEGMKNEILSTLYKFSEKISFDEPFDLKNYLELLLKVYKSVYEGKNITKNQGVFNILVGDYKKEEKAPIILMDSSQDPENDPESLIFSATATELVKKIRKTSRPNGGKS